MNYNVVKEFNEQLSAEMDIFLRFDIAAQRVSPEEYRASKRRRSSRNRTAIDGLRNPIFSLIKKLSTFDMSLRARQNPWYTVARMSPILHRRAKDDPNASRRILLIIALCLFVVALSLVIIQSVGPSSLKIKTYTDGYSEGFNKARKEAAAMNPALMGQRTMLAGRVTGISGNTLLVEVSGLITDKNVDGVGNVRTVVATKDTQLESVVQLSTAEMAKQQQEFIAKLSSIKPGSPTSATVPPAPIKTEKIVLSDLKIGDMVSIYSGGTDLSTLKTINASKISRTSVAKGG
jgi:hypothetical protein